MIRPATEADIPALLAIWNPVIRDTTIIFATEEKTAPAVAAMIAARRAAGREFFVAAEGGRVLGFASYDQFRAGDGYATAMEHTVMMAPEARGQGTGRALMVALEAHARGAGAHTMQAGVSGENAEAIGFHERLGYREVGRVPESGRKFGRWLDLVILQKML
jgi:L-amino acid N-acyltransferase